LYGEFRRPQKEMLDCLDVLLIDLQDVGCRIYTFLTTLFYCLEECSQYSKKVVVLDRPNPAGRMVEGLTLNMDFATFVGAAPLPMRHGLTLGEAALWYKAHKKLDVDLEVVAMDDYDIRETKSATWPSARSWVNPSPNIPRLSCTQMYAGTVMIEGTLLSEGRGTTLPLEMFGAPGIDGERVSGLMRELGHQHLTSCLLRPCFFEPAFHKHCGQLCGGLQVHVDYAGYDSASFYPFRLVSLFLKAVKTLYPALDLWRQPPYEYEEVLMPIDILSGDSQLRHWVESNDMDFSHLDSAMKSDEKNWLEQRKPYLLY